MIWLHPECPAVAVACAVLLSYVLTRTGRGRQAGIGLVREPYVKVTAGSVNYFTPTPRATRQVQPALPRCARGERDRLEEVAAARWGGRALARRA